MVFKRPVFLQVINVIAFVATVAVNMLAGSTRILNGLTSGEVSDMYPTLITPAGFTFSIWGIIYVLLLVFTIYQVLPKNRDKPFLTQISVLFALSGILNISWLFLWHYQLITHSLIMMLALLASLIGVYLRLNIGRVDVSLKEKMATHLPFSVYLGWISIATMANVAVALTSMGWDGFDVDPSTWAVIIIYVALLLTATVLATRKDIAFCFVVVWALIGILAKQGKYPTVVLASEVGIALILVAAVVTIAFSRLKG